MWEMRSTYWVLLGKPEGDRLLGRHRHKLNNVKMDL
jgi:hypothetical protein